MSNIALRLNKIANFLDQEGQLELADQVDRVARMYMEKEKDNHTEDMENKLNEYSKELEDMLPEDIELD